MKQISALVLLLLSALFTQAQVTWNFGTSIPGNANPSSGVPANLTVSAISQGNNNGTTTLLQSTSVSSGYTGASGSFNATAAVAAGALNTATSTYFEITLTPATGFQASVSSIQFGTRSTASGPTALNIRSSVDAYAADAAAQTVSNNSTWVLAAPSLSLINGVSDQPVTIRIYASGGTGALNTANWRIDDLQISAVLNTLPVKFASFSGQYNNNAVNLQWTAASTTLSSSYTLEKSSDGRSFSGIGTVQTSGTGEQRYNFTDRNITSQQFYRIAYTEAGKIQYSDIVKVNGTAAAAGIKMLSTLTGNIARAEVVSNETTTARLLITDMNGRTVKTENISLQKGVQVISTDVAALQSGTYTLLLISNQEKASVRFIKN
jgi:hypothetical protein